MIPSRFNGPAASANGGYACGVLAAAGSQPGWERAVVTLRLPPPLDTAFSVVPGEGKTDVLNGDDLIATVTPATGDVAVVPAVPAEVAQECEKRYQGDGYHPFPTCFSCGPDHPSGLRLRPGPVPDVPAAVACTWTPGGTVDPAIVWAALDCPGGWTADLVESPRVLGRMSAQVHALPEPGVPHVLVARSEPPEGRKMISHTALYTEAGALLAAASAVWIKVATGDQAP